MPDQEKGFTEGGKIKSRSVVGHVVCVWKAQTCAHFVPHLMTHVSRGRETTQKSGEMTQG